MSKNCSDCKTCWVMKIDPRLRKLYGWSHNWPQFEGCGQMFDGTQENILCFSEFFARTINWKELEKSYLRDREKLDKMLKFNKEEEKEDGRAGTSEENV